MKGTLVFDGECRFCCLWVARWKAICGPRVEFVAFQSARIPDLDIEACQRAVQWVGADGSRASGARAVFEALAARGGFHAIWLHLYLRLPFLGGASEFAYRMVAANRGIFFRGTRMLWGKDVCRPQFAAGTWWFLRALAATFLLAFVSYAIQADGLVGEKGILPAGEFFSSARTMGAGVMDLPSLLWLGAGNDALLAWCVGGAAVSLFALFGVLQGPSLLAAWAIYLSLCVGGQVFYQFQWDGLLLEVGFLGALIAPWGLRAGPARPPQFLARLLLVWLLVRLMVSSGAAKLVSGDPAWWPELDALVFHYFTQPLPTPAAWFADRLPLEFQKLSVLVMFFIELCVPWFLFAPRRLRHAAAFLLIGLQAAIAFTGNYGFFNLLTVALCLLCLDDTLLRRPVAAEFRRRPVLARGLIAAVCLACFTASLVPLAALFNIPAPPALTAAYAAIAPFRTVNPYGLFATMTRERPEILVQGSQDGVVWETYEFRFKPGDPRRPPPIVAPFMPRLDWQMWFAALGRVHASPWFFRFGERLLEAEPSVLALLENDPFAGKRPRFLRANLDTYRFSTPDQLRIEGAWWQTEPRGIFLPEITLNTASETHAN